VPCGAAGRYSAGHSKDMSSYIDIPGFELIERLGAGSVAQVWKARQASLDRMVALKIFRSDFLADEASVQRLFDEARAAGRLKHPGIVVLYDAAEANGAHYFVLEYVEGRTLTQWVAERGPRTETEALQVALHVGRAMDYAWRASALIHGNISPGNIMIDTDGRIKVADLGLARSTEHAGMTTIRSATDTPSSRHYLAPEQLRMVPVADCTADMYALGATLYYLTTARTPFEETTRGDSTLRSPEDALADPRKRNPKLSEGFVQLLMRMTMIDPADRYRDWPHALRDIESVLTGAHGVGGHGARPKPAAAAPRPDLRQRIADRYPGAAPALATQREGPLGTLVALVCLGALAAWLVFLGSRLLERRPAPESAPADTLLAP
jgi:eukaryotic-like serine/threonine-protein kinase